MTASVDSASEHPRRGRGADAVIPGGVGPDVGASPRARGGPSGLLPQPHPKREHPRGRGADWRWRWARLVCKGASPRARGGLRAQLVDAALVRSIPAGAGRTLSRKTLKVADVSVFFKEGSARRRARPLYHFRGPGRCAVHAPGAGAWGDIRLRGGPGGWRMRRAALTAAALDQQVGRGET